MKARTKILKSKTKLPPELVNALESAIKPLEQVAEKAKRRILKWTRTKTREIRTRLDEAADFYERHIGPKPFWRSHTPPPPDQL